MLPSLPTATVEQTCLNMRAGCDVGPIVPKMGDAWIFRHMILQCGVCVHRKTRDATVLAHLLPFAAKWLAALDYTTAVSFCCEEDFAVRDRYYIEACIL